MFDLNKPLGYDQFLRAFNSGGAGGGPCVATDGETVWAFSTDGGPKYVYRADGKSFGVSHGANRSNGYLPDGWVTAMAAWRDAKAEQVVRLCRAAGKDRGILGRARASPAIAKARRISVNKITVHDGDERQDPRRGAARRRPRGLAVHGDALYALHADGEALRREQRADRQRRARARGSASSPCRRRSRPPTSKSTATVASTSATPRRTKSSNSIAQGESHCARFGRLDGAEAGQLRSARPSWPRQSSRPGPMPSGDDRLIVVEQARAESRERVERRRQTAARIHVAPDARERRLRLRSRASRARLSARASRAG